MNPPKPVRCAPPNGAKLKPLTAYKCYVNLCTGLGMRLLPNTPSLAIETGAKMRGIQQQQNKAMEALQRENAKLRRQVNYFAGRHFWQRVVGVFRRPQYCCEEKATSPASVEDIEKAKNLLNEANVSKERRY